MALRAPKSVQMGLYLAELVLKGFANLKFKFEINIEGEKGGKLPHKCCLYKYFVTFSKQLSKASCLIAEAFYFLGAGACKMAAEQAFLQNVCRAAFFAKCELGPFPCM